MSKKFYALMWNERSAYRYDDEAIRDLGVAQVRVFTSKADRDRFVEDNAYTEAISAKRAYKIGISGIEREAQEHGYACYEDYAKAQRAVIEEEEARIAAGSVIPD